MRVSDACKLLRKYKGAGDKVPRRAVRALLHMHFVPGLTGTPVSEMYWVAAGAVMSVRERMLVSGVQPWNAMSAVAAAQGSRGAALALSGTYGATVEMGAAVIGAALPLAGLQNDSFSIGSIGCGLDRLAMACETLRPLGCVLSFACDHSDIVAAAHASVWLQRHPRCRWFWEATGDDLLEAPPVQLLLVTLSCGWLSRQPVAVIMPEAADEKLGELRLALRYMAVAWPKLVVIETVVDLHLSTRHDVRLRWDRELRRAGEGRYLWREAVASPHTHAGEPHVRMRIFWVGVLGSA